ncbi:MAG: nucleotidyltransferase family protein, partial [Chromatiales bacterium]|nr:nucleotidyltransferase family protein [Chromatiales bacterium]
MSDFPNLFEKPEVAMILAAGRGERMRPLTDYTPKPLLPVAGKPLIEYHIDHLVQGGFKRIVINYAHLGEQIVERIGTGRRWGIKVSYSAEPEGALETGGGIAKALPLLGDAPFLVVNGDIWSDYPLAQLACPIGMLAHLVLVGNPQHHAEGDFHLDQNSALHQQGMPKLTFSGIGVYRPELFASCPSGAFPLGPLLRSMMDRGRIRGE